MLNSSNNNKAAHLVKGEKAEQMACEYLQKQGLQLIARNFRCQYGEIDLIMNDAQTLVIIEVRYRKNARYGSALESITLKKQQRIIATTCYYLETHKIAREIRFDVIAITGNFEIEWLKNAFLAGD